MDIKSAMLGCSIAALALTVSPAFAQTSDIDDLKRRVSTIETKLDAIYELLQKQSPSAPTPPRATSGQSAASTRAEAGTPAAPVGYVPGMYLDVFATGLISRNRNELPGEPSGFPSGSVTIKPRNNFDYGAILEEETLKKFAITSSSLVGVRFSGKMKIGAVGPHSFQLNLNRLKGASAIYSVCDATFSLSGQRVVTAELRDGPMSSSQGSRSLSSGLYDYSVFVICNTNKGSSLNFNRADRIEFSAFSASLLMAGPGDRAPKPIPAERFFIKAE